MGSMKFNAWDVQSVDEFIFFCCPDCDTKIQTKNAFLNHAWQSHPESQGFLLSLETEYFADSNMMASIQKTDPDPGGAPGQDNDDTEHKYKVEVEIKEEEDDENYSENHTMNVYDEEDADYDPRDYSTEKRKKEKSYHKKCSLNPDNDGGFEDEPTGGAIDENDFKCDLCDKTFASSRYIKKHMLVVHPEECEGGELHACDLCDKTFKHKHYLTAHQKYMHSDTIDYQKCEICDKVLRKEAMRQHRRNHGERKHACDLCDRKFVRKDLLVRHKRQVHDKERPQMCHTCGASFFEAFALQAHIRALHSGESGIMAMNDGTFHCSKCEKVYNTKKTLLRHLRMEHEIVQNESNMLPCEKCGQMVTMINKQRHMTMHHPTPEMLDAVKAECVKCKAVFSNALEVNEHHRMTPACANTFVYKCELCEVDTEWASSSAIRKHNAEVHGRIVHACEICDYVNKDKTKMWLHKNAKHQAGKFQCDMCPRSFSSQQIMLNHKSKQHLGEYSCNRCDHTAKSMKEIFEHSKAVHERDIFCDKCNFSTYSQRSLDNHKQRVHFKNSGAYQCDVCEKRFTTAGFKTRHMIKFHRNNPPTGLPDRTIS